MAYLDYRTYSEADFVAFLSEYDSRKPSPPPSYMYKDFGKPNETASHQVYGTKLDSVWLRLADGASDSPSPSVVLRLAFDQVNGQPDPHVENGAPSLSDVLLWQPAAGSMKNFTASSFLAGDLEINPASIAASRTGSAHGSMLPADEASSARVAPSGQIAPVEVPLDVVTYNKTISRLPEAMFVRFNPDLGTPPSSSTSSKWRFHTIGEWIEPADVVIAGNNEYHVT